MRECDYWNLTFLKSFLYPDKPAANVEREPHKPNKTDRNNRMDIEICESKADNASQSEASLDELSQSEAGLDEVTQSSEVGFSQPKIKSGKNQDDMDIELSEVQAGERSGEICSAVIKDSVQEADLHPPPAESVASTSDGKTANQVRAFSGVGRTLSDNGWYNRWHRELKLFRRGQQGVIAC